MSSQHNPSTPSTHPLATFPRIFVWILIWLAMLSPVLEILELNQQAEPAKYLVHAWGRAGFIILCANLIAGSLWELVARRLSQFLTLANWTAQFLKLRRQSGVMSFVWLSAHAALLVVMEAGVLEAGQAIAQATYLQVALAAWLSLAALAATSNRFSQQRLGRRWRVLHRLAYVAFSLGLAHTLLIEKADLLFFGAWGALVIGLWILRGFARLSGRSKAQHSTRPLGKTPQRTT
ncbi:MAG TPA: ferric reductase-like transmembrane domain-containing protein [Pseudobdellovibrionaceae bacterium]|nr:ferric reductase-like transmembrane domain-containing protein [Pseudobdellovibrionaceae bacterium]